MNFRILELSIAPERIPGGFSGSEEESLVFSGSAVPVDETGFPISANPIPINLTKPLSKVPQDVLYAIEVITNFVEQETVNALQARFQEFERIKASLRPLKKTIEKGKAIQKTLQSP